MSEIKYFQGVGVLFEQFVHRQQATQIKQNSSVKFELYSSNQETLRHCTGHSSLMDVIELSRMNTPFDKATEWISKKTQDAAKSVSKQIDLAAEAVQQTTDEAIAAGQTSLKQVQQATDEAIAVCDQAVEQTVGVVQEAGTTIRIQALQTVEKGLKQANQLEQQAQSLTRPQIVNMDEAFKQWQAEILAAGASGVVITQALKDLPRTAQELAREMPALARRIQTAGIRTGDGPRSSADIMALFDKIPGTSKLGANERDIRVFLSDKHGSHIHPHSKGGGNEASNILWELGRDNIHRGAEAMTGGEQIYIRFYNAVDSILKNSLTLTKLGVAATGTAILTQALVTALAHVLDLYRGDITIEEFRDKIVDAAVRAGIATPIFFLILVTAIALFPEIVVVLSAPAVVAGFNALFIVGIALPIIQSIIRHVEAGGFGEDAKAYYATAIQQGDDMLKIASEDILHWWHDLFHEGKWVSP